MATLKVSFPQGEIYLNKSNSAYIKYNDSFKNEFNDNINKTQAFLDSTVVKNLSPYVSFRSGVQEKSIKLATVLGSGIVTIGVPYAEYQAYSKRITKRVGLRGTQPFERMRTAKKDSILKQVAEYSRRLNNG